MAPSSTSGGRNRSCQSAGSTRGGNGDLTWRKRSAEECPSARIAAGDLIVALAVDETPKHRPEKVLLRATRSGGDFSLNGSKCFVVDGHVADLLIVAARTSGAPGETHGITLFMLDSKSKGLQVERTITVDSHNAARVVFDNVLASTQSVLGELDHGWSILESALNAGRAALASGLLGAGDEVFARTFAYLKERKQFGKFIGEFQALQHRSAQPYCELKSRGLRC